MDDLVRASLEEIALEGSSGCSLSRLWSVIDPHYQRYLSHFRISLLHETSSIVPKIQNTLDIHMKTWLWRALIVSSDIEATITIDGRREIVEKPSADLRDLLSKCGEKSIHLTASHQLRCRVVLGETTISAKQISDATMAVLTLIASNRTAGISQKAIADKMKMDNRTVFYHVQQLLNLDLVVKFPVVTQGSGFLLMVVLKKFHDIEEDSVSDKDEHEIISSSANSKPTIDYHACRALLTKELSLVKGRKMSLVDLREKLNMKTAYLRRYFKTMTTDLIENGYVERIYVKERAEDSDSIVCLRLIKLYDSQQEGDQKTSHLLEQLDDIACFPKNLFSGALVDLPPEQHAYMLSISQGSKGLHSRSLSTALRIPPKILFQIMSSITENKNPENYIGSTAKNRSLKSEAVNIGRSRILRFFSSSAPTDQLFFGTDFEKIGKIERASLTPKTQVQVTQEPQSGSSMDVNPPLFPEVNTQDLDIVDTPLQSLIVPTTNDTANLKLSEVQNPAQLHPVAKNPRMTAQSLERRANLLKLLAEERILELNTTLTELYQRRFSSDESNAVFKPDKKTLFRLATSLQQQGEAVFRTVEVNRPLKSEKESGGTVTKYYLVAKDADVETEIGRKVEEFRRNWVTLPAKRKTESEIVLIDESDERLSSVLKQRRLMREQMQQKKKRRREVVEEIDDQEENNYAFLMEDIQKSNEKFNRMTLEISGMFHGRYIKLKYFHSFIWEFLNKKYGENQEEWILYPVELLDEMPLYVYLHIFGHNYGNMSRQEYFDVYGENTHLKDLPENLLDEIRKSRKRVKKLIVHHLGPLLALNLLTNISSGNDEKSLPYKLQFNRQVDIIDWTKEDRPSLYSFDLKSLAELESYWEILRIWFTSQKTSDLPFKKNDPLFAGEKERSWTMWDILPEQRKVLEAYCDRATGETPYENLALCRKISEETNMTLPHIRLYYRRILEASKKPIPRVVTVRPRIRPEKSSYQDEESSSSNAMVDMTANQYGSDKKFRSRVRRHWTDKENKLILISYTVLNYRVQELGIMRSVWPPISSIFPNIPVDVVRRQFHLLMRYENWRALQESLTSNWDQIYQDGVRLGSIEKPRDLDIMKFDLIYYVNYFITHLGTSIENVKPLRDVAEPTPVVVYEQPKKKTPPLPATLEAFLEIFTIESTKNDEQEKLPVDVFDTELTSVMRMSLKYAESWSIPANDMKQPDTVAEDQAKSLVKMVILTEPDLYDVETAHALTCQRESDLMKKVTEKMKKSGIIVEERTASAERRIPGRAMSMSQKYQNALKNSFPEKFLENARNAYNSVEMNEELEIPETVEDGTMLYVLSARLLDHGAISLRPPKFNEKNRHTIDEHDQSVDCPIYMAPLKQNTIQMSVDTDDATLETVNQYILNAGSDGTTLQSISMTSSLPFEVVSDCIHHLANNALIFFSPPGLITHASHIPSNSLLFNDSQRRVPYMWLNIHGTISETILKQCLMLVLGKLVQYPGISSKSLSMHLAKFMTSLEVADILRRLVVMKKVVLKHTIRHDAYFPTLSFFIQQ